MLALTADPAFVKLPPSGTRARGYAYERAVGKWLQPQAKALGWTLHDHPWLRDGESICQPDFLLEAPSGCIIIIETKLTETNCAPQFTKYKRALNTRPTIALQIARRIISPSTVDSLEETIDNGLMLLWI